MAASSNHVNVPLSQQRAMNYTLTRLAHFCCLCGRARGRVALELNFTEADQGPGPVRVFVLKIRKMVWKNNETVLIFISQQIKTDFF